MGKSQHVLIITPKTGAVHSTTRMCHSHATLGLRGKVTPSLPSIHFSSSDGSTEIYTLRQVGV